MGVASGQRALRALTALMGTEQVPASTLLHGPQYLPDGIEPSDDPHRLDPDSLVGGYGNEARYQLHADQPELALAVAGPPAEVLSGRPNIASTDVQAYVQTSLDLTMQGGTTSGVVYPLAVCELATEFRFRNVGGASAGAIAAAITAAAELGRSELVRHPELASARAEAAGGDPTPGTPRIRRGFVGLTDLIGWLTQTREADGDSDEYRLAQLFRPGVGTGRLWRVLVAAMRQRTWALPLLALTAFRWGTKVIATLLILGTVALTGWTGGLFEGERRSWPATLGWGLLDSATFLATVIALALLLTGVPLALRRWSARDDRAPGWLRRLRLVTSRLGPEKTSTRLRLIHGAVLLGTVVALAIGRPAAYASALVVGLAGSLVLLVTLLVSTLAYVNRLRSSSFGLIAGTAPAVRRRGLLDVLAGVPRQTVEQSVVPWLDGCLSQLAGLPSGEVLRFGHLWSGADYHQVRLGATPEQRDAWLRMSQQTDERLVNLELMTTDLTRQRPYRFPLPACAPDSADQLWLDPTELADGDEALFPAPVLAALSEGERRDVVDRRGVRHTLVRLPDPWDLPVIFAVRLSMALPVLFQAVRMYRLAVPTPVRDDFGRELLDGDDALTWPESSGVADEVWFSDGGITSNFPVHFFDASLPRWPTVSLNLGEHPESAPHQDVSLPQDWDVGNLPVQPLTESGLSLAGSVFHTAMSWRDNMQSAMPGYRNRIAQVRTRPDEGGANLFMPRAAVASLALRGALAGARLRTRFGNPHQWDRFRWLRLRVAVSNLERLRGTTDQRVGFYSDALAGPQWLEEQQRTFCDVPSVKPIDWYEPPEDFWPDAGTLLETFATAYEPPAAPTPDPLTTNVPRPEPVLRQVPQE